MSCICSTHAFDTLLECRGPGHRKLNPCFQRRSPSRVCAWGLAACQYLLKARLSTRVSACAAPVPDRVDHILANPGRAAHCHLRPHEHRQVNLALTLTLKPGTNPSICFAQPSRAAISLGFGLPETPPAILLMTDGLFVPSFSLLSADHAHVRHRLQCFSLSFHDQTPGRSGSASCTRSAASAAW